MISKLPSRRNAVFGVLGAVLLWICYGVYEAGNDTAAPPGGGGTSIVGGEAVGHRYSTTSWSLEYDTLRASNDNSFIEAIGVRNGMIYRKNGPPIHASADRATINLATKDFDIEGNVRVTATFGGTERTFETASATWSQTLGKLTMPGQIRLTGKGATLTIAGIDIDARNGKAQFGKIEGTVRP